MKRKIKSNQQKALTLLSQILKSAGIALCIPDEEYTSLGPEWKDILQSFQHAEVQDLRFTSLSILLKRAKSILTTGNLALGEAYMRGDLEIEAPAEFARLAMLHEVEDDVPKSFFFFWFGLQRLLFNFQTRAKSMIVAEKHYNLPSELYVGETGFLGYYNQYTCGLFNGTTEEEEAQELKLHLIGRKLDLKPDDVLLDIGCGWGGFAKYAAEKFGCKVIGISIAKEQLNYAQEFCAREISEGKIQFLNLDYREIPSSLSHLGINKVSVIGMIEHVGFRNYHKIFRVVDQLLRQGRKQGLDCRFLIHTIGATKSMHFVDPFISKYIFPNSNLPSVKQLTKASERYFHLWQMENFGVDYAPTLNTWDLRFQERYQALKNKTGDPRFDETFYRLFRYYFKTCEGLFESGKAQLYHFLFGFDPVPKGLPSVSTMNKDLLVMQS